MSDSKDNKKKGFFSRLLGGFSSPKVEVTNEVIPAKSEDIPTKSASVSYTHLRAHET